MQYRQRHSIFSVSDVGLAFAGQGRRMLVFDGLSVDIEQGESFGILGPSGAGKTVFLKMLAGLVSPSSGQVLFRGENIVNISRASKMALLKKVGMTFQRGGLFDSLTAGENLSMPLRETMKLSNAEISVRVEEALRDVGLEGTENLWVH